MSSFFYLFAIVLVMVSPLIVPVSVSHPAHRPRLEAARRCHPPGLRAGLRGCGARGSLTAELKAPDTLSVRGLLRVLAEASVGPAAAKSN